jgi:hypothetical protein
MSTTCFGQYYFWPSSGWVQKNGTERSETSAYKIQTPEKYPEESIQHSEHGGSLKSGIKPRLYRTAVKKISSLLTHKWYIYIPPALHTWELYLPRLTHK